MPHTPDLIYKIATRMSFAPARDMGHYTGMSIDTADGYMHFSTAAQLSETLRRHFKGETELVLLAMGFLHAEPDGVLAELGVDLDPRGNVKTDEDKMTTVPGVFAAGDMARGQSLVVWALAEGREAARGIDERLMGKTTLARVLSAP